MKTTFFLLLLTIIGKVQARDTTFTCIAKWKKGDHFIYDVSRIKSQTPAGESNPVFQIDCTADISVLNADEKGYRIEWVFHLTKDFKEANPVMAMVMPMYEGMKIIYHTSPEGEFDYLENWEQVRQVYVDLMMMSLPKSDDEKIKKILDKTLEMFGTRQVVESAMIPEVRLFHMPYGGYFSTKAINEKGFLPNPFNGEDLPALHLQLADSLDKNTGECRLTISDKLDSTGARIMMESMFSKLDIPQDSIKTDIGKELSGFSLENKTTFKLQLSSGQLLFLENKKQADLGNKHQHETVIMRIRR